MSLPRPPQTLMRNPLLHQGKKHIVFALLFGTAIGLSYKVLVTDPRKRAYANHYK